MTLLEAAGTSVSDRLSVTGTANALELRGVSKLFGALAALSDIDLIVQPGERRAVLGSNGAGKTTLFNCITGDFAPTTGSIRFFGKRWPRFPPRNASGAGCAGPTRSRFCSLVCLFSTTFIWPVAVCPVAGSRLSARAATMP